MIESLVSPQSNPCLEDMHLLVMVGVEEGQPQA